LLLKSISFYKKTEAGENGVGNRLEREGEIEREKQIKGDGDGV
jgi:hypothetical protein